MTEEVKMPPRVMHVKVLQADDGYWPKGWPRECVEAAPGAVLTPGYDAIMSADELAALQESLQPARDALLDGRVEKPGSLPPLSRRQLLLGLLSMGITENQIYVVINSLQDNIQRETARIEFENNDSIRREHPLVTQLSAAMSLRDADIDRAWIAASAM